MLNEMNPPPFPYVNNSLHLWWLVVHSSDDLALLGPEIESYHPEMNPPPFPWVNNLLHLWWLVVHSSDVLALLGPEIESYHPEMNPTPFPWVITYCIFGGL